MVALPVVSEFRREQQKDEFMANLTEGFRGQPGLQETPSRQEKRSKREGGN